MSLDLTRQRRRVIFIHLPKCAGNSVLHHFRVALRGCAYLHEYKGIQDSSVEIAKAERFVSGHFCWQTLQRVRDDAFVFTVMRDPFSRLKSQYWYLRENESLRGHSNYTGGLSFDDYLDTDSAYNVMARQIAGHHADEISLTEAALRNLETLDFVGFTESIDEDLQVVCGLAGVASPSRAPVRNVTREPMPAELNQSREKAMTKLAADYALYARAKELRGFKHSVYAGK